jgi:hypothetical protein
MPGYRPMPTMPGYRCLATYAWLPMLGYQNTILIYQCFDLAWLPNNLILEGWLPIVWWEIGAWGRSHWRIPYGYLPSPKRKHKTTHTKSPTSRLLPLCDVSLSIKNNPSPAHPTKAILQGRAMGGGRRPVGGGQGAINEAGKPNRKIGKPTP